jgi:hypothetical protein
MHDDDKLSLDLVWQADGHLTEIALTALGDGEEALLPDGAAAHAAACPVCAAGLGHAALLSLQTSEALRGRAAHMARPEAPCPVARPVASQVAAPLPVAAILAALAISALGAAPSLAAMVSSPREALWGLQHSYSVVVRAGCAIAGSGAMSGIAPALSWISAALLLTAGLSVARIMGSRLVVKGGT